MRGPFRNGDIVGVDYLGRGFLAEVTGEDEDGLTVNPIPRNVNYYHISKRDVRSHWSRRPRSRVPLVKDNGGLQYG